MEQPLITGVTSDDTEAKVTVSGVPDQPGIAARLFRLLADADVNVDLIVQNTSDHGITDISFTVPHEDLPKSQEITSSIAAEISAREVTSDSGIARVSLVGAGMKSNPGVAAKTFETLAEAGINIEMISTSAIRISCVVAGDECDRAVSVLHAAFGLDRPPA